MHQTLKEKIKSGHRVFGTVLFYITDPRVVDVLPDRGLDFVMVHVEHSALDISDYTALSYSLRSKGIACLARTHSHEPDDISRICDAFADGVVVPYVEDVEHLKLMVAAAKCRPLKGEARRKLVNEGRWPSEESRAYVEEHCRDTVFVAMIESPAAVRDIEKICSVGGIDALLIGPNDLTVSMGIPEQRDNPLFVEATGKVISTANSHGIAAGGHFSNIEHTKRTIRQGARLIVHSNDIYLVKNGIAGFIEQLGIKAGGGKEVII